MVIVTTDKNAIVAEKTALAALVLVSFPINIILILGGWAFAELGNVIPRSGGPYAFFTDSYGPLHKYWGGIPAFIYAFTEVLISQPCGIAIVALTSAEYLVEALLHAICIEGETVWLKRLIAIIEISKSFITVCKFLML